MVDPVDETQGLPTPGSSPPPEHIRPGEVVGGKYIIERLLGEGGMGAVYVARQDQLGRHVAIKLMHPAALKHGDALARFEREARAAAALKSDHVARVLDVGHLASGAPYLVMDLLDGEDLSATLRRRGPLPPDEVIDAITQASDALGEAHGLGIIHRDIKPANLFRVTRASGRGTVKVLDFGISKATGGVASTALTRTSSVMGSPLYMSPEQLREARTVDARSDIWSLGATMFELLTGALPFDATSFADLCSLVLNQEPRSLRALRPDVSVELEAVVMRCLQRDPAARYASVAELVAALGAAQASPAWQPPQVGAAMQTHPRALATSEGGSAALAGTHSAVSVAEPPRRPQGGSRAWLSVLAAAASLAVLAGLAFALMTRGHVSTQVASATSAVPLGAASPSASPSSLAPVATAPDPTPAAAPATAAAPSSAPSAEAPGTVATVATVAPSR